MLHGPRKVGRNFRTSQGLSTFLQPQNESASPRTVAEFVRLEAGGGAACVIQGSRASPTALNGFSGAAHVVRSLVCQKMFSVR